jgi:flagellar protein FliS
MSADALAAYKASKVTTADPVTLVVLLFEGALKAVRKARIHHEAGNQEKYVSEVERATLIVGELLAALDTEQGEIPKTLSGIYSYSMSCLLLAMSGDVAKLDEVEMNIGRIAQAWTQAARNLAESGELGEDVA